MRAYKEQLATLDAAGLLVLAAAGNEQVDNDALSAAGYANVPCNVPLQNVIAVGATDQELTRWAVGDANPGAKVKGSNFGAATVDMSAPGAHIVGAKTSKGGAGASGDIETRFALLTTPIRHESWHCRGCLSSL